MPKLFVYGTLRRAYSGIYFAEGQNPLAGLEPREAEIRGKLFILPGSHIPALSIEDGTVRGEVYEVGPDAVDVMDLIEGHPNFYVRTQVQTLDGETVWVYALAKEPPRHLPVEHGEYQIMGTEDENPVMFIPLTDPERAEGFRAYVPAANMVVEFSRGDGAGPKPGNDEVEPEREVGA